MSIGTAWHEKGIFQVDKMVNGAEKCMYEDKIACYKAHNIKKRM